MPGKKMTVF
jgi:hypothetical protein